MPQSPLEHQISAVDAPGTSVMSRASAKAAAAAVAVAGVVVAAGKVAGVTAMAVAVPMADGPVIHIVPAIPQYSQEKDKHSMSTPPMLPPLHVSSSPPAADAAVLALAATSIVSLQ
jgi:hypothetical protein